MRVMRPRIRSARTVVGNLVGGCHGLLEVADRVLGLAQGGVDDTQVAQGVGLAAAVADLRAIARPCARAGSASVQRS